MSRFRVLHLIRPAAGGMKNHLLSLLTHSDQEMFEPVIACPGGTMADEITSLGFKVVPLPIRGELSPLNDWLAMRRLAAVLKNEQITILHAHSSKAGFIGRIAARLARTPVVFMTAHNSIFYEEWPFWKKAILAFAERFLSRYTDRIITVSEALRQELIKKEGLNHLQVLTIHNGIETEYFNPPGERRFILRSLGLSPAEQVVGTVARLAPQKGITYFLKAASLLIRDYKVNFVIIGEGPLRQQLEAEAASLGLKQRVVFAGERHDIPAILIAFDVFVLPSLTEGFPLTILEALAAARPVVATRAGGIPEIIQDKTTGLLVEPADPTGLALAVATLLTNRQKAMVMGQTGQIRVKEKFTAAGMVRKVEEEYKKVLLAKGLL
jgi:glycosyltransferase involved in cell wall biosynthesis